ncbi:MAG: peptide chain release factor N(5)-glutamine methyltransferase [Dehalococcoidales bacterium]|nr:peptide chain release factor N(5)-glutamine methyltransferase [Dehalococcoidales bacterium]MDP6738330.1 peptide chain release factor N(5)-glutamine methyltransferase [Dehalococcoidales bacterium]
MKVREVLSQGREALITAKIDDASLEAEVLLRYALGLKRVQLYLQLDRELSFEESENFWQLIRLRLSNEPTAYITGHREFYGLDFDVDGNVLIPRPESELLVETALGLTLEYPIHTIADVGTGSGALAISLAVTLPRVKIYATDISSSALGIAQSNCQKHGVLNRIWLLQGDLLEPLPEPVNLIVANLPYVREEALSQVNTRYFEPHLALDGGPDGLEMIRRLGTQVGTKLRLGGGLLLEIGLDQGEAVVVFFRHLFPSAEIKLIPDGCGIDRVMSLLLPSAISPAESGVSNAVMLS